MGRVRSIRSLVVKTLIFSCNNGQCIKIDNKCNGVIDCNDGTDELECEFLILDKKYSKNKLPLIQDFKVQRPVKVYFGITMTAYPRIDTANSKIITEYDLNLKWYDPRLMFRDLKPDETFNDLAKESKTIIWSPKVEVSNVLGQVSSQLNDEATSIMLLRESEEDLPEDFSLSNEGIFFYIYRKVSKIHRPQQYADLENRPRF